MNTKHKYSFKEYKMLLIFLLSIAKVRNRAFGDSCDVVYSESVKKLLFCPSKYDKITPNIICNSFNLYNDSEPYVFAITKWQIEIL